MNYKNALNNYMNNREIVRRQKQNLELADKVYKETSLKYREGLAGMSSLLQDEMSLRAAAYMASEIIMPCCCMMCNKAKLEALLSQTKLCAENKELTQRLAALVYDDLARCNGLG